MTYFGCSVLNVELPSYEAVFASPPEPPHDNKKPEDEEEEHDMPKPVTSVPVCYVLHSPKGTRKDVRRLSKGVRL
jgi:hypothetical protein